MKNLSIGKILTIIIACLLVVIFIYAYFTFCFPDGNIKDFFSELSLSFISGLFLALVVFLAGIFLEEKRKKELKKVALAEKLTILENLLKNTFQRGKSNWNFSNRTPTFYFDNDWINPLYDLLTHNNREWEVFIQEYKKSISNHNDLIDELNDFIKHMDIALINAEKLDNKLKFVKISPELAASLSSGFRGDRIEAKKSAEFSFWIFRAAWAGANSTEIMFGIAFFTEQQLRFQRIEGLSGEAISLGDTDEYKELVKKLKSSKKKISKKITIIKKLTTKLNS